MQNRQCLCGLRDSHILHRMSRVESKVLAPEEPATNSRGSSPYEQPDNPMQKILGNLAQKF